MKAANRVQGSAPARRSLDARLVAAIVFLIALGMRAFFLFRLRHSVLDSSLNSDEAIYWQWASVLMQHGLEGRNAYFMGPLYPHVVAVLRFLVGSGPDRILAIQMVWGACACTLLADAVRRLTSSRTALVVGLLLAVYEMAILFDGLLLTESLLFLLGAALLWVIAQSAAGPMRLRTTALLGGLVGLMAQCRATFVLELVPLGIFVATRAQAPARARGALATLLASAALVCLPSLVHNYRASGELIPFTYNFGFNFYVGNHAQASGSYSEVMGTYQRIPRGEIELDGGAVGDGRHFLREVRGQDLRPAASSRYWATQARDYIVAHPGRTVLLTLQKMAMFWNRREYPQIESREVFRRALGPIGVPGVGGFALWGLLGLAGAALAWRRGPMAKLLVGFLIVQTVAVAPFFVTDRYRHHLVPVLVLLAGYTVEALSRAATWRMREHVLRAGVALLLAAVLLHLPLVDSGAGRHAWDVECDLGNRWLEKGRPDLALAAYERAATIEAGGGLPASSTPSALLARAGMWRNRGLALLQLGRAAEAVRSCERAAELAPDAAPAGYALAEAYAANDDFPRAALAFARLRITRPEAADFLIRHVWEASKTGGQEPIEAYLRTAVQLDSSKVPAWVGLIRLQVQSQRVAEAELTLARARRAGMLAPTAWAHAALIAVAKGDREGARLALAQISPAALAADPAIVPVVSYVREALAQPPAPPP